VLRYERVAFPDAFQRRIRAIRSKLEKEVSKLSDVSQILIRLQPFDEIADQQTYEVELIFVMPESAYADAQARVNCEESIRAIVSLLGKCEGIELADHGLQSEAETTLHDLGTCRVWSDFEFVSFKGEGQ
jgi:hypothetical protein